MAGGKNILSIYIGDDITDEDAFRALKNKGITVFVGRSKTSCARYRLSGTDKVHAFLKRIVSLKSSIKP
jgi:trehalose-phosphatase